MLFWGSIMGGCSYLLSLFMPDCACIIAVTVSKVLLLSRTNLILPSPTLHLVRSSYILPFVFSSPFPSTWVDPYTFHLGRPIVVAFSSLVETLLSPFPCFLGPLAPVISS
jgi:hypothetical protein